MYIKLFICKIYKIYCMQMHQWKYKVNTSIFNRMTFKNFYLKYRYPITTTAITKHPATTPTAIPIVLPSFFFLPAYTKRDISANAKMFRQITFIIK